MIRALTIYELNNDDLKTLHYRNVKYDELSRQDKCLYDINETLRLAWKLVDDYDYHFTTLLYHAYHPPRFFKIVKKLYEQQGIELRYVICGMRIKLITNKKNKPISKRFKVRTSMSNEVKQVLSND